LANSLAPAGFVLSARLPTYYQGYWIWLSRETWTSFYSRYEPRIGEAIKAHLNTGEVFWDIGAHIGLFSLLAARIVGPKGKVFSFEPSPDVFGRLSRNISGLASIRAIQCGVGNSDGSATFAAQGIASSASFVEDVTKINQHFQSDIPIVMVDVNIRRVDTLAKELGTIPRLMKIDVEGFELEVLRGASGLLSNSQPTLIVEVHPPQLKLSSGREEALFQLLKDHGYGWEIIDRSPSSLYSIVAKAG
jgi:FkbM family methyltransferase